jgi:hypothetical protein
MPRTPTITNHVSVIKSKNMFENLAHHSLDETAELKNSKNSTQLALA